MNLGRNPSMVSMNHHAERCHGAAAAATGMLQAWQDMPCSSSLLDADATRSHAAAGDPAGDWVPGQPNPVRHILYLSPALSFSPVLSTFLLSLLEAPALSAVFLLFSFQVSQEKLSS